MNAAGAPTLSRSASGTRDGFDIPILSVANIFFGPGYSTINRTDGMRKVTVSAGVDTSRANANEIFAALSSGFFKHLEARYPGLKVTLQGEQKKMRESFSSLYVGFPMALVGIFIIIATMFPLLCPAVCHHVHHSLRHDRRGFRAPAVRL